MLKKEEMQSPESSGQHTRTDLSPDNQSISDDLASLSEDSLDEKEGQAISSQPEPANEIDLVQDDVEIGALDTDRLCTASPSFLPRIAQTFAFCTSTGKLSVLSLVRRIYWSPDLSPDAAQAALQDATGNTAYLLACRAAGIKPCADILLQAAPLPSRPRSPAGPLWTGLVARHQDGLGGETLVCCMGGHLRRTNQSSTVLIQIP